MNPRLPPVPRRRSMRLRLRDFDSTRWIADPQWRRELMAPFIAPSGFQGLRVLTLNIAHGRKLATHQALLSRSTVERNLGEIAKVIGETDSDVVALQEADGPSAWSGNFDHVERLARQLDHRHYFRGEHNPFALGRRNLASGTALLGRLPLDGARSHRFGISWRDTKGFVIATVPVAAWEGVEVDVVSLHLEPVMPLLRRRQIAQVTEALLQRPRRPLVVLGDFNCSWSEEALPFRPLARHLGLRAYQPHRHGPTYPSRRPWRRIDWILISPELEFAGYRTLRNAISDHLGVVAELRLRTLERSTDEPVAARHSGVA
jgi:endonuclease/exonuclease/phosphatase family metal-dependent hydrolase